VSRVVNVAAVVGLVVLFVWFFRPRVIAPRIGDGSIRVTGYWSTRRFEVSSALFSIRVTGYWSTRRFEVSSALFSIRSDFSHGHCVVVSDRNGPPFRIWFLNGVGKPAATIDKQLIPFLKRNMDVLLPCSAVVLVEHVVAIAGTSHAIVGVVTRGEIVAGARCRGRVAIERVFPAAATIERITCDGEVTSSARPGDRVELALSEKLDDAKSYHSLLFDSNGSRGEIADL
jgi:hypothetical protein